MGTSINLRNHNLNAFDFLRVTAASAVLFSHSYALYGLPEPQPITGHSFGSLAVATFFVISGFLVCQSWLLDPSFPRFLTRRFLRIFPGLLVVILMTVFVIGPIFGTLVPTEYFSSVAVWQHLILGLLALGSPPLPRVFENNPYPISINGSLWTLRYEILMYILLASIGRFFSIASLRFIYPALFVLMGINWVVLTNTDLIPLTAPFFGDCILISSLTESLIWVLSFLAAQQFDYGLTRFLPHCGCHWY